MCKLDQNQNELDFKLIEPACYYCGGDALHSADELEPELPKGIFRTWCSTCNKRFLGQRIYINDDLFWAVWPDQLQLLDGSNEFIYPN